MIIISYKTIRDFADLHPAARAPLDNWYAVVNDANWGTHADLKRTFSSADFVGNERYVFNIAGNKFRLIAAINFKIRTVYIKYIGLHQDYDKIDASNVNRF